jgi:hypothetical protein
MYRLRLSDAMSSPNRLQVHLKTMITKMVTITMVTMRMVMVVVAVVMTMMMVIGG